MRGLFLVSLMVVVLALGVLEVVASQRMAERLRDTDLDSASTWMGR
jgi:Tfp pilus assembly protein PilE